MKIRTRNRTTYNYSEPVSFGQHRTMIRLPQAQQMAQQQPATMDMVIHAAIGDSVAVIG